MLKLILTFVVIFTGAWTLVLVLRLVTVLAWGGDAERVLGSGIGVFIFGLISWAIIQQLRRSD
jgi:hypothetical protein